MRTKVLLQTLFALALIGTVFGEQPLRAVTHPAQTQPDRRIMPSPASLGKAIQQFGVAQPGTLMLAPAVGSIALTRQTAARRHTESEGGFSYVVPEGWRLQEVKQQPFKVVFARADGSRIVPNVFFLIGQLEGSVEAFKEALVEELQGAPGFALVEEGALSTDQGSKVIKLVANSVAERQQLRQVLYLVDGGAQVLVAIYTRLRASQQQNDSVVEAMIKTIEWTTLSGETKQDDRHVEPQGGFSYAPPQGWTLADDPGSEYKVLRRGSAFVAFSSLARERAVKEYNRRELADELSKGLSSASQGSTSGFANVRLVEDTSFQTKLGYDALKFVFNAARQRQSVRVTAYVVDLSSVIAYVIYVRPRIGAASDDRAIEDMVNTLAPVDSNQPATREEKRHYEQKGNFSYTVPSGWQTVRPQELGETQTEFAILVGPSLQDGLSPAVRFYQDTLRGSFLAYVRSYISTLRNDPSTRSLAGPEEFTTDNGIVGAYWVCEYVQANRRYYAAFYALPDANRVIAAVYTRPLQRGASPSDEAVDAVMRSFRFGR
ncbi:MAG: hypothetical protein NZ693_10765 [Thermoflexales bacterium]|nr:hypothetical protein [Thermoflexales bacterium]